MKKNNLQEGDLFKLPMVKDYFVIGLIVRIKGMLMYAVFFDGKDESILEITGFDPLNEKIILRRICSALGLKNGDWKILGKTTKWNKKDWPIPLFRRKDLISGNYSLIKYNDELKEISETVAKANEKLDHYPEDGVAGYGLIEKQLAKLLS